MSNDKRLKTLYALLDEVKRDHRKAETDALKWALVELEGAERQRTNDIQGQPPGLQFFTGEEVMKILKISRRTLYTYLNEGRIKGVKTGRQWKISEDSLREFMEKGYTPKKKDIKVEKIGV